MNRTILAATIAATLAAPALASNNLAASLGVDAGAYTTNQLVALKAAKADDDHSRIRQIMAEVEAGGFDGASNVDQIAISIDATDLRANQVLALKAAMDDDDAQRIFSLRNGEMQASGATFSTRSAPTSSQLAASVGVEPGTLSTSELIRLKAAQDEDDSVTIQRILKSVN